jgi:hypothetical protein
VPAKESVPPGEFRSVASWADQVALDLESHAVSTGGSTGAWRFDLDTGAPVTATKTEKTRMDLLLRDAVVLKPGAPASNLHLLLEGQGEGWQRVWAYGPLANLHHGYVAGHHAEGGKMALDLVMAINGDAYLPPQNLARYRVTLTGGKWPRHDSWSGEFTGFVGTNKVSGSASVQNAPFPPGTPNYPVVAPGEHPRLLFRKEDIPYLRRRLKETALGRAFQDHVRAKNDPVGQAVLYALEGDKSLAEQAKQALFKELDNESNGAFNTGQVWAGRMLTIATIWDCCRDLFTAEENARIENTLLKRMEWLFWNRMGGGFNAAPTSNWGGPTRSSGAIAALLFAGDPGEPPPAPGSRTEERTKYGYPVHPLYGEIYRKPPEGSAPDADYAAALADFGRLERAAWEAGGKRDFVKQYCVEAGRLQPPWRIWPVRLSAPASPGFRLRSFPL